MCFQKIKGFMCPFHQVQNKMWYNTLVTDRWGSQDGQRITSALSVDIDLNIQKTKWYDFWKIIRKMHEKIAMITFFTLKTFGGKTQFFKIGGLFWIHFSNRCKLASRWAIVVRKSHWNSASRWTLVRRISRILTKFYKIYSIHVQIIKKVIVSDVWSSDSCEV